ncbi:hypothetical protein F4802DRAFT_588581 [Xylaria palmicola]|nr:hypothetical protein F4802DRAFT_588581 [Xylaria palmicola]
MTTRLGAFGIVTVLAVRFTNLGSSCFSYLLSTIFPWVTAPRKETLNVQKCGTWQRSDFSSVVVTRSRFLFYHKQNATL